MAKKRKVKKTAPKKKKRVVKRRKKSLVQAALKAVTDTVGLRRKMNKGRFEGT